MHYYQHHIGDFIRDTSNLTDSQLVAYLRLIWLYYDSEEPLPDDSEALAFKTRSTDADVRLILRHYFTLDGNVWRNSRCDREIIAYKKRVETGKSNISRRWSKNTNATQNDSNGIATVYQRYTDAKKNDTNQEPITNNQEEIQIHKAAAPACAVSASEVGEVVSAWNEIAAHEVAGVAMHQVRDGPLSDNRKRSIKSRLSDKDWRANWRAALDRIKESTFCHGQGSHAWIADFDWFIRKDTVGKILEGKYDNRDRPAAAGQRDNVGSPNRYRQGDFAAKAAEAMRRAEEKGSSLWGDSES